MTTEIRLDEIIIEGRHRDDLGDIQELAASIDRLGLLHPVVVTVDLHLVAGERRLAACAELGWDEIPVTVADNLADIGDFLQAERDENTCRKSFTPSEAARQAESLAEELKKDAKGRQQEHGGTAPGRPNTGGNFPQVKPKVRDVAAIGTGYSEKTLRKVREIEKVATAPDTPEPVRSIAVDAIETMNATGKVDGPHQTVKAAEVAVATQTITEAIDSRQPNAAAERAAVALKAEYSRAMVGVSRLPLLDAEAVGAVISETDSNLLVAQIKNSLLPWAEKVQASRKPNGLRLVKDA